MLIYNSKYFVKQLILTVFVNKTDIGLWFCIKGETKEDIMENAKRQIIQDHYFKLENIDIRNAK